jgi:hypothetical protein
MTMDDKELQIKYLEMIQAVISRMGANGFAVKGWATALVTVILAFLAKDANPEYAWIAFFPIMVFWSLDAYFLSLERAFRELYKAIRNGSRRDFDLTPPPWKKYMLECLFWRPAITPIYLMLVAMTAIVWCWR